MQYEPMCGDSILAAAQAMQDLADATGEEVTASFNDITIRAVPGGIAAEIVETYTTESQRRHEAYLASPEHAERQREAEEADATRKATLAGALMSAPSVMGLKDEPRWREIVEKNGDPYGACTVRYSELWARLMEGRIASGATVEDCAEDASHIADDEGITGFMYGCAVQILSAVWIHGEELRRWHNLKTQIHDDGAKANESGGVLNPAIISIG